MTQNVSAARAAHRPVLLGVSLGALLGFVQAPVDAHAETSAPDTLSEAIANGKPIFTLRPRYEHADQSGVASAEATTLRTTLGWQTAQWRGLTGLIEFEDVRQLAGGNYNDGVAPTEPYATIADPDVTELNRAQLAWQVNTALTVTVGRQLIALEDQRFVGTANWRQDQRTYDAVRADLVQGGFKASYAYIDHVNRHLAEEGDWESNSHILHAAYTFNEALRVEGFTYLLDFDGAAVGNSSDTFGVRATGGGDAGPLKVSYAVEYATVEDAGDNPVSFDLNHWSATLNASHGPVSARVSYEVFEGDGTAGFITPLSANHGFHGWAEVFKFNKPADGLIDLNVTGSYAPPIELPFLSDIKLTAKWFDFEAERTGADLGDEIDLGLQGAINERLSATIKYADYDSGGGASPVDVERAWLQFEYKL